MVDVVLVPLAHIAGIDQVEDSEHDAGDGQDHVKIDLLQRGKKDVGKDDGRNGPGCAYGTVMFIVSVPGHGRNAGQDNAGHIEQQVKKGSRKNDPLVLQLSEDPFDTRSKGVENQHVDPEVHIIGMQEGMGEDPVILVLLYDVKRGKVKPVQQFMFAESGNGDQGGDNDDNQRDHRQYILGFRPFESAGWNFCMKSGM